MRYEALYIGPGMLDGYWDNKTKQYLDDDTIIALLNQEDYDSIWEKKCRKLHKRNKELQHKVWRCNRDKKPRKEQKISYKSIYRFR